MFKRLLLGCLLITAAFAQPSLTLIQSNASVPRSLLYVGPSLMNGYILISTPNVDSNNSASLPGTLKEPVTNGAYSFSLVPTDTATPNPSPGYQFKYVPSCSPACPTTTETVTVQTSSSPVYIVDLGRSSQSNPPSPGVPTLFNPQTTGPGYLHQNSEGAMVISSVLPHIIFEPFSGAITAGTTLYLWTGSISCNITSTYINVDPGGSAQIDVWKTPYLSPRPTVANSITGGNYPSVSGATIPVVGGVTGWTNTSVLPNDNWAINIVSVSNTTFLGFGLECDSY